jgi:hypothetical protein
VRVNEKYKRFIPAIAIFLLVTFGLLQLIPTDKNVAVSTELIPTVVFTQIAPAGTNSSDLVSQIEIRMMDMQSRASGSLSSIEEIPSGVLVSDHVEGQQLLISSIAANAVDGLGVGFVAVSVAMDAQRWIGPLLATGTIVDVYEVIGETSTRIAENAVILNEPTVDESSSNDQTIISLAVPGSSLNQVLVAANENRLWLVGVGK